MGRMAGVLRGVFPVLGLLPPLPFPPLGERVPGERVLGEREPPGVPVNKEAEVSILVIPSS